MKSETDTLEVETGKDLLHAGYKFVWNASALAPPPLNVAGLIRLDSTWYIEPRLGMLIEACGVNFIRLERVYKSNPPKWIAWGQKETMSTVSITGDSRLTVVAKLWLVLRDYSHALHV